MAVSEFSLEFGVKVGRPHAKAKATGLLVMTCPQKRGASRAYSVTSHSSGLKRSRSGCRLANGAGQHVDRVARSGRILHNLPKLLGERDLLAMMTLYNDRVDKA